MGDNKICLWLESKSGLSKPDTISVRGEGGVAKLMLPTYNSAPIPSPLITREYNLETPNDISWQCHNIKCLYIDVTTAKKLDSTDKLFFAQDLLFWIQMLDFVSEILEYHLYIPSIKSDNTSMWSTYHPDLELLALQMPDICSYIDGNCYSKTQLLQYFFDSTVTHIAQYTNLPQAQEQIIRSTLLEKFLNRSKNKITEDEKKNWLIWKSALDKLKHDICIKIEAPKYNGSNILDRKIRKMR